MAQVPDLVREFLGQRRIAVAGVSRGSTSAANAVYRKLRTSGYEVFPVNPKASEVEGVKCYRELKDIPDPLDGVVVATHPDASVQVVRQAADLGVRRVWFHRSVGGGSVSAPAVEECRARGIQAIVGGCPLMYCDPVDGWHRCMRSWLSWRGRLPK